MGFTEINRCGGESSRSKKIPSLDWETIGELERDQELKLSQRFGTPGVPSPLPGSPFEATVPTNARTKLRS